MTTHIKFNGGYVGLISMLITIVIIGFAIVYMYGPQKGVRENGLERDSRGKEAIQEAERVKAMVETNTQIELQ